MTDTQLFILLSVAGYILANLAIGYWASRLIKNEADFIIAGGRLGWALSIGTIFATWFGAETCMGSAATAFSEGILGVIADPFGAGLCLILSGIFFARYFKRNNYETIIDFFEDRFGKKTASILSILYLPTYLGWIGAQLLAFGYILNSLTGFPLMTSVLISTAVVLVYTYWGGMWADTMTDFFQMIILVAGLFIIFPVLVKDMGGMEKITAQIPEEFFHWHPVRASTLDWLHYIQAWIIVGLGSLPAQDLFSRTMAARNATVSRWSSIMAGVFYILIGLVPVLLGIFGRVAIPENSGESILIDLALKYLSPLLIAVFLGALLAAIMSSADSALLAPSSIIGHNILPYFKPSVSHQEKLKYCRLSIPVLGIISLAMALYFQNIYKLCQESWGILLTGVAAPMFFGVYWKRTTSAGALSGAIAGIICWLIVKIFLADYPANLFGFLCSCCAVALVSVSGAAKEKW